MAPEPMGYTGNDDPEKANVGIPPTQWAMGQNLLDEGLRPHLPESRPHVERSIPNIDLRLVQSLSIFLNLTRIGLVQS